MPVYDTPPAIVQADQRNDLHRRIVGAENTLLVEQTIDTITTQVWIHTSYPCADPTRIDCHGTEGDPLARPVEHTFLEGEAAAIGVNALVRLIPQSRTKLSVLRVLDYVYPTFSLHNIGLIANIRL